MKRESIISSSHSVFYLFNAIESFSTILFDSISIIDKLNANPRNNDVLRSSSGKFFSIFNPCNAFQFWVNNRKWKSGTRVAIMQTEWKSINHNGKEWQGYCHTDFLCSFSLFIGYHFMVSTSKNIPSFPEWMNIQRMKKRISG